MSVLGSDSGIRERGGALMACVHARPCCAASTRWIQGGRWGGRSRQSDKLTRKTARMHENAAQRVDMLTMQDARRAIARDV